MIDIFDDTLEHHNAELVDMTIRNLSWKYDYSSTGDGVNKHWHIFCGHTPEECIENGYEPEKHIEQLFNALCTSTNFDPSNIKETSIKTISEYKGKTLEEISDTIIKSCPEKNYYSRIFTLGIYKILSIANDFKEEEDIKKISEIEKIFTNLNLPLVRAEKDISLFKSSIKKFEQAKELIKETIKSEREKRNK